MTEDHRSLERLLTTLDVLLHAYAVCNVAVDACRRAIRKRNAEWPTSCGKYPLRSMVSCWSMAL